MNIKELRIGSLVQNEAGDVFEVMETGGVVTLWDGKYAENINASELSPIPLTPEVLEGCGFESDSNSSIYMIGDRSVIVEFPRKEQGAYGFHRLRILNTDDDWRGADLNMVTNELPLHRLQNIIFDLTGEELDVEGVKNLEI